MYMKHAVFPGLMLGLRSLPLQTTSTFPLVAARSARSPAHVSFWGDSAPLILALAIPQRLGNSRRCMHAEYLTTERETLHTAENLRCFLTQRTAIISTGLSQLMLLLSSCSCHSPARTIHFCTRNEHPNTFYIRS